MRQERLAQAATAIRTANSLVLACHVRPDADALGSLLGLKLGLEKLGKQVTALSADGVPSLYRFLPGWETVEQHAHGQWDLGIGIDCDGSDRIGPVERTVLEQPLVIDIDHHTGPDPFGQIQVVDRTAAASGELIYELLRTLDVEIDPDIAVNLLAAILTDTGSFRFSNVTPNVLRIAAELVEAGAHPAPIYEAVYGSRPFAASRLLGSLLSSLQCSADGKIVWASLQQADFIRFGVDTTATEGFVDQIRMVEGSEVAVFFREEPAGEVRVSLRSRGNFSVAAVAEEFDGGGHVPAAGCTLPGPVDSAIEQVIGAIEARMSAGAAVE